MPNTGAASARECRGWCSLQISAGQTAKGQYLAGTMWLVHTKGARPFGLLQRASHGATTFELLRGSRRMALQQASGAVATMATLRASEEGVPPAGR